LPTNSQGSAKTLADGAEAPSDLVEALKHARSALAEFARDERSRVAASEAAAQALALMSPDVRRRFSTPAANEELYRLVGLVDARQDGLALELAEALLKSLPEEQQFGKVGCEARLQRAKAFSIARKHGKAADSLREPIERCKGDNDYRARLLYLGGKYARLDGRHMQAIQRFEQLEREAPEHRLADDARLYAAQSYFKLGVEARFTQLLSNMPRDYPRGDMVMDGV